MSSDISPVIAGQIYLVKVRMERKDTGERIKHRLLVIGGDRDDADRRLKWHFDAGQFTTFSITNFKRVSASVNVLSTEIHQDASTADQAINRAEGTVRVQTSHGATIGDMKVFAVGVTTKMIARDSEHALRLTGQALIARGVGEGAFQLSEDSTVMVEELHRPSQFATARDVSAEVNRAHIVRG